MYTKAFKRNKVVNLAGVPRNLACSYDIAAYLYSTRDEFQRRIRRLKKEVKRKFTKSVTVPSQPCAVSIQVPPGFLRASGGAA